MKIDIYAEKPDPTLEYKIAVMQAAAQGAAIQARGIVNWLHVPLNQITWNWLTNTYRVNPAAKPKPKMKKVPLTVSDFEGKSTIWLSHEGMDTELLVVGVGHLGLVTTRDTGHGHTSDFAHLMMHEFKYSFDRVTWHPCHKEVPDES